MLKITKKRVVAFKTSVSTLEVLARVLELVDSQAIKREAQTSSQHPIYAPLAEQWEDFVHILTKQAVRQYMIKTADDRVVVVWAEKVLDGNNRANEIERVVLASVKQHGYAIEFIMQNLIQISPRKTNCNYGRVFGF